MAKQELEYYFNNKETLTTNEIRIFNRYYLHPKDNRMCNTCRLIFEGIRDNYHIKRYHDNKTKISYNVQCRTCQSKRNLEHRLNIRKKPETYIKGFIAGIKARAKEQKVPFDVDADYLVSLFNDQNEKCYYTGIRLSFDYHNPNRLAPHRMMASLDKKVPNLGYVRDNVVWTLYFINRMKNDLTTEEFIHFCKTVMEYREGD